MDAIADKETVIIAGIMEHIEEAGIHSGDSACTLPPYSLSKSVIKEIEKQTKLLAKELEVVGLMNIQFAVKRKNDAFDIYILEVNPRASRTVPFVAKATGTAIAKIAAKIMVGKKLKNNKSIKWKPTRRISVKEAVFPFKRFKGVDILLGPEMKSTGEVMGLDLDFGHAFAKSQIATGVNIPLKGNVFISVKDSHKNSAVSISKKLIKLGFKIIATKGTAQFLINSGLKVETINKVREGRPHIVDIIKNGKINLIFNTTEGEKSISDSYSLRQAALYSDIPYYTTISGSKAAVMAIEALKKDGLNVIPLQDYK